MDGFHLHLILLLYLVKIILGEEYGEDTHPAEEYIPIFENIPTLFEYLLETLEKRPEVLENNEANVFKRDTNCVQGVNKDCESNMPLEDNEYCLDINEVNRRESNKEIYKRDLEQDGIGCTGQANEDREEHKLKRSVENFGNKYQDSITMRKFKLTPEEVAQTALEVEKMLEDYEAKNNRK